MNEYQMIWKTVRDDVDRKVMEWRMAALYADHAKVRHVVIMEPRFSLDVLEWMRQAMDPYLMHFSPEETPEPPRFPSCTYLFSVAGVEYYADGLGKIQKWEVIVGVPHVLIDLHTATNLPKGTIDEAKGALGLSMVWGNPAPYQTPPLKDMIHPPFDPWAKLAASKNESWPSPHGGKVLRLTMGKTPQDAVANPENYLVCEGCGDIKHRPDVEMLTALMCAACLIYDGESLQTYPRRPCWTHVHSQPSKGAKETHD